MSPCFLRNRETKVKKILMSEATSVKMKPQESCHETSCLPNVQPKRSKIQIQRTKRDALSSLRGGSGHIGSGNRSTVTRERKTLRQTRARAHIEKRDYPKKKNIFMERRLIMDIDPPLR